MNNEITAATIDAKTVCKTMNRESFMNDVQICREKLAVNTTIIAAFDKSFFELSRRRGELNNE